MSVLETPRILFRGQISWDPIVTNNYPANYDENTCETVFVKGEDVAAFRQSAINQVTTNGNWNPHGTFRSSFFDTYVSGVDQGNGPSQEDPFVLAPAKFTGMLVDCEPYGAFSSQLFFDAISFGIEGGCRIYAPRTTRFTDRYISFSRNPSNNMIAGIASVVWQTCFPKNAGLLIDPYDSPTLQALKSLMDEEEILGLMIRWDAYRTVYYDDPTLSNGSPETLLRGTELQTQLYGGGFQPNPARSLLVGCVGLWRSGDPIHEPGDRAIIATGHDVGGGATVGSAHARLTDTSITLDLSNAIPDQNRAPEKFNLGDLKVVAVDSTTNTGISLATFSYEQYNQAAYEQTSGILELPIPAGTAQTAANMDLELRSADDTIVYLSEVPLRALPNQPNLYIDQGQQVTLTVQVYQRGNLAGAGIKVTMTSLDGQSGPAITQITDANGVASFIMAGATGSVIGYALLPGDNPTLPVSNFNPQAQTYMYLRVLPADVNIAELEPTWQNVRDHVLGNWQAMAPCMDNWLDLGNETQVKAYATMIKNLTDPQNFESFRYMPVTRDMTMGQRTLLYNFLDGKQPSNAQIKASVSDVQDEPNYNRLSKAMRTPE